MTRFFALVFVAAALTAAGCESPGPPKAKVSGQVSLDGESVQRGVISFTHEAGKTPSSGAEIKDGRYDADIYVGTMIVKLSYPKVTGKKKLYATPDSPVIDLTTEMMPDRYNKNSELKVTVEPGSNVKDFILKSK